MQILRNSLGKRNIYEHPMYIYIYIHIYICVQDLNIIDRRNYLKRFQPKVLHRGVIHLEHRRGGPFGYPFFRKLPPET